MAPSPSTFHPAAHDKQRRVRKRVPPAGGTRIGAVAACRLRAVDQEYVSDQDIRSLADQVLEPPKDEQDITAVAKA